MTKEIYTEEFVINELQNLLKELKGNLDYIYIGELFEDKDYTRQRFSEWSNKFPNNKEIQRNTDTIKEILETRAVKGLLWNKLNSTWTIFHLKNNYKWVDKQEVNNTNLNRDVTEELTDAQKEKIAKRFMK